MLELLARYLVTDVFIDAIETIDSLADKLVDVLDFLGIVLRIPNSIMGLTVLAW